MGEDVRSVIIVGSGPAGYTAGLYTARALLNPLMFAGYMSGGQLMLTSDVENFPGYPKGIGGPEMMIDMREQAERFGLEVQDKNVERVDLSQRPFGVWVEGEEFKAESLIFALERRQFGLGQRAKKSRKGVESPHVPLVTVLSSETKRSLLLEVVIQQWRRRFS